MHGKNEEKFSEDELLFFRDLFRSKNKDAVLPEKSVINYCAIFGSLPGENVKAKSDLVV